MKHLQSIFAAFRTRAVYLANEAKPVLESLFLPNAFTPAAEGWVQLSPFGDFGNRDAKKQPVIQRFQKSDAEAICNQFNGTLRKVKQPLGMPFYVGHPDHPSFKGQPGHTDPSAKGRGREMAVRHADGCAKCADFANSGAPCGDHGLFVKMHWNEEGQHLIANEAFHGHSVNWSAVPAGMENGVRIMRPTSVKSAGFTNEPNIPVTPAQLANELAEEVANDGATGPIVPPRLKLIAGYKADDDVTMEQVMTALEKARPAQVANAQTPFVIEIDGAKTEILFANADPAEAEALAGKFTSFVQTAAETATAKTTAETELANEKAAHTTLQTAFANERKARATLLVEAAVKAGRVILADKAARIEGLCNAGEAFDTQATQLANAKPVVKTSPVTVGLARGHSEITEGVRARSAKFEGLMSKREQDFPNESYEARYEAVAASPDGAALFAQMQRPGGEETKD